MCRPASSVKFFGVKHPECRHANVTVTATVVRRRPNLVIANVAHCKDCDTKAEQVQSGDWSEIHAQAEQGEAKQAS